MQHDLTELKRLTDLIYEFNTILSNTDCCDIRLAQICSEIEFLWSELTTDEQKEIHALASKLYLELEV